MQKWEQLHQQIVFNSPYFNIRKDSCRLPNGHEIDDFFVLQSPDIALAVACTSEHEFVLVEQYKHGIGQICLELPGGMCEPDSTNALDDAKRELQEETGYVSDTWHKLATLITNPTRNNSHTHIYLALDVRLSGQQMLDENEDINIHLLSYSEIKPTILQGSINVPDSVAGLMLALDWLKNPS